MSKPSFSYSRRSDDVIVGRRQSASETLISRRKLLYGAIGVGTVAAIGAGAYAINSARLRDGEITYLEVPDNALTTLNDMEAIDNYWERIEKLNEFELPYGTLIWANSDNVAACLLPTETGSPLTHIALLWLGTGQLSTVVDTAVGVKEGYEIYDVRGTESGIIWTESDVLDGTWRIYTARLSKEGELGEPVLADSGDSVYETPTLAAVGQYAFWQVLPKLPNSDALPFQLKRVIMGRKDVDIAYESARRMGTVPYAGSDCVVITPRVDSASIYYQLTCINAKTNEVVDTLVLPHAMRPLEAGYGKHGFTFSFDSIYNYGGGISNLGTYTPLSRVAPGGNYSEGRWFGFARTPTVAPAWAGDLFIVKSFYSVCGVDMEAVEYFAIDVDDGADSYGEYLATSGSHDTIVTFANIDYTPVNASAVHCCRVKVWKPIPQVKATSDGRSTQAQS